jgi:VWFA-related protein
VKHSIFYIDTRLALRIPVLLALLPAPLTLCAQQDQPSSQPYRLQSNVREVMLDVVVTDSKGKIVENLKKEDFTVYESGVPQRIRSFSVPADHSMPVASEVVVHSTADLAKIGNAPVTMLVLDELNTSFEDMAYSRNRMEKFLNAQGPILKQPTIMLAATNVHFEVIHDFTQDRGELLKALKDHQPDFPWKMMKSGSNSSGAFERMGQSLNSLLQMAQATRGTKGRKTVIWVGKGFPSVNLTAIDPDSENRIQNAMKQLTQELLAARVTLYTIDPESALTTQQVISTTDDLEDFEETQSDGQPFKDEVKFSTLAPATGGSALFNRNDIDAELADSLEQGSHYYSLTYSPTDSTLDPDKYRQVRIKMSNPNWKATTRDGYYAVAVKNAAEEIAAKPPEKQKEELQADFAKAALSTIVYNGLNATLEKTPKGFNVGIPAGDLTWVNTSQGKSRAEVTVMLIGFSAKDKVLAHTSQELSAEVSGRIANPAQKAYFDLEPMDGPKIARYRVVVRDAQTGKIGTAETKP